MLSAHKGAQPLPPWRSEQVFFSATQWYASFLQGIHQAKHAICLQTYIFELDTVGEPVLQALCAAAERGVAVRVMVDGVGSSKAIPFLKVRLERVGAQFQVFHPLPWAWVSDRAEHSGMWLRFFQRLLRVNNRQHSKLCLVDHEYAWVGSFNITDDHLENNGRGQDWKDCGAQVTGERCRLLREFFDVVWFDDVKKLSPYFLFHPMTNFSKDLRRRRLRVLLQHIHAAKQRVWIVSAYFSPVPRIVIALKKAARRGVDVCVMTPAHSDVRFFPALASTYYADLLRADVKIYEYEQGILHSKLMLVDDNVLLGSSNMNHRSILHDTELDISLFCASSRTQVIQDFSQSLIQCREITLKDMGRFRTWLLLIGQIPRLLRYWL